MKIEGWEKRLSEYIQAKEKEPFKWGENDCILFAAKAYEVITGEDHYSQYLPYSTKEEAYKILRKNKGFEGIIGKNIGLGHNNYLMAKRGDPVLMNIPDMTCGIVDDSGQYIIAPGENGIVRRPLSEAIYIWSIK